MLLAPVTMAFDRSERFKDQDGRLHVRVTNLSKATVNPYRGNEIPGWEGLGLEPGRIYQLFRDPEELARGASTFNNIPLLSKHVGVSAQNPREELVAGSTGTDAAFVSPYLQNSLVIWRQEDIDYVESGKKCELSCAYYYDADMKSGTFQGLRYDGVMRNLRGNHVALVEAGRAGPDVLVHDSRETVMPQATLPSRKALLVKGALAGYLRPKLMAGTVLALDAALGSVNRLNWQKQKPEVIAAVNALAKPKLAKDASLDDMADFLGALDAMEDGEEEDDEIDAADSEEDDEEKKKKAAEDRKAARDAKRARDKKAMDEEDEEKKKREEEAKDKAKDKKAMDAAIETAVSASKAEARAAAEAREFVRPWIGSVSLAMDEAPAIYKMALDHLKVDTNGVDPSAFKAILSALPKPGQAQPARTLAMDSASAVHKRFPKLARIGQG
jgi:hypothetical protein